MTFKEKLKLITEKLNEKYYLDFVEWSIYDYDLVIRTSSLSITYRTALSYETILEINVDEFLELFDNKIQCQLKSRMYK